MELVRQVTFEPFTSSKGNQCMNAVFELCTGYKFKVFVTDEKQMLIKQAIEYSKK